MELKFILEALLFSSQKPLSPRELRQILSDAAEHSEEAETQTFKKPKEQEISDALAQLETEHAESARSYRLVCIAGAWQFVTEPEFSPWLKSLVGERARPARLSQPALETLAIIAYRQPLTRAEIEQIRGVSVDGVMQTLTERGLVEQVGRAEVVGRPMTYGTTALFLEYFGMRSLDDLPSADELRRIPVSQPETLQTAQEGLATAPPSDLSEQPERGAAENEGTDGPEQEATSETAEAKPDEEATQAPEASPSAQEEPERKASESE